MENMQDMSNTIAQVNRTDVEEYNVFCTIAPLDLKGISLEKSGFTEIPYQLLPQMGAYLQYLPGETVALSNLGSYKAVFDKGLGVLQKSAKYPGLVVGNIVSPDANNDIKSVAAWRQISSSPQIALSIFTAASMVTGQYFMAQMNSKLSQINQGIINLRNYMEADDFGALKTTDEYFQSIFSSLYSISQNDVHRQSSLTNVTERKIKCNEIVKKYEQIIEEMNLPSQNKEDIDSSLSYFSKYLTIYHYALHLYASGVYLEMILSQNTNSDYLDSIIVDIQNHSGMYDYYLFTWENKFNRYIDEAKALRHERRKEKRNPQTFMLKEGTPARYKAVLARYIYDHKNLDSITALRQQIEKVKNLYNNPVEAVISDGKLFFRCVE
jgi:hypothetical protein